MTAPLHSLTPKKEKIYTLQAYLDREAKAAHKSFYFNGKIVKMAGAKAKHNQIAANVLIAMGIALEKNEAQLESAYILYNSDQKIYIEASDNALYPDALAICNEPEFWNGREDLLTNPLLVVEVLSESTRKYDAGSKFMLYKKIPSFKEYMMIEQDKMAVEVWTKTGENKWEFITYTDPNDEIVLYAIESIKISLSSIYKNIKF